MTIERHPPLDTTDMCFDEKMHYAKRTLPKMYNQTAKFPPLALVTPLFSIARAAKGDRQPLIDLVWTRKGRGSLRYTGRTLTQSHLTVLLTLINHRAGGDVSNGFLFYPNELLAKMGWGDSSGNRAKLSDMLDDLKAGQLRTWAEGQDEKKEAERFSIIDIWRPSTTKKWSLSLNEKLLLLYTEHPTDINLPRRAALGREGLGTFLYGYLMAESCRLPFTYVEIHAASGSKATNMGQFGKEVRRVLDGFKEARLINDWQAKHCGFKVQKPLHRGGVAVAVEAVEVADEVS